MPLRENASATERVAYHFVTKTMQQRWQYNYPHCRRAMSDAAFFISHKEHGCIEKTKEKAADNIIKTLDEMVRAGLRPRLQSVHCINWKKQDDDQGRTWYDVVNTIPPRPPVYETLAVQWWQEQYGGMTQ